MYAMTDRKRRMAMTALVKTCSSNNRAQLKEATSQNNKHNTMLLVMQLEENMTIGVYFTV